MSISTGTPKRGREPYFHLYGYERIRKIKYIEFGGQTIDQGFRLIRLIPLTIINDRNISIIGPDIIDMKEGTKHSLGIVVDVGGNKLEKAIENVYEVMIDQILQLIDGIFNRGICGRNVWIFVWKEKIQSFKIIGKLINKYLKAEFPEIEKVQTTFFIDKADPVK
ncbi:MAG: hypothetical protein ACFFBP_14420 [Promethearchaeota archaeon]